MKSFEERYGMKDELSKIEISRLIWSGFEVYIEY